MGETEVKASIARPEAYIAWLAILSLLVGILVGVVITGQRVDIERNDADLQAHIGCLNPPPPVRTLCVKYGVTKP